MLPLYMDQGAIFRQNGKNIPNLISQRFIQDMEIESVARLQEFQIGEHLISGHTGMAGQDTVASVSADRKR